MCAVCVIFIYASPDKEKEQRGREKDKQGRTKHGREIVSRNATSPSFERPTVTRRTVHAPPPHDTGRSTRAPWCSSSHARIACGATATNCFDILIKNKQTHGSSGQLSSCLSRFQEKIKQPKAIMINAKKHRTVIIPKSKNTGTQETPRSINSLLERENH